MPRNTHATIPLFAWQFAMGDDRDDGVQVVFARNEARAMVLAARQSGGGRGDRSEVTRVENFDKYITPGTQEGANPDTADFFEEGYWVTCSECEHRVSVNDDPCWRCIENVQEEREGEDGERTDDDKIAEELGGPVTHGGGVYCNQRCLDRQTERAARRKAKKAEATAALLAKYPFVRPMRAWVGGSGSCDFDPQAGHADGKACYDRDHDNVCVHFKVPGGELSEKTSDGNATHNVYCHGCGRAWIAKGDYPAFECHAVRPTAVVGGSPS